MGANCAHNCFGSLMDIDKLIRSTSSNQISQGFGSLMDIDKLIQASQGNRDKVVLVL